MMGKHQKLVAALLFLSFVSSAFASNITETFSLLKKGQENIKLSENKNIVLVLGNTGSGKSTFLQWFAGDNSKLISKQVGEIGSSEFIIADGEVRIGSSTVNSMTIFPELVEKDNISYYDCPGFSDTRSSSHEIAITYFIKDLCDHAESLKIVFAVGYPSLRIGVDRQDFMKLLKHTADFIKDIKKFTNSIAMVATKVNNQIVRKGNKFEVVEDDVVIRNIAIFLENLKPDMRERIAQSYAGSKSNELYENIMDLIDILLTKENDKYTKIGLFKRPDESGPLKDIALLEESRPDLEEKLITKLSYTEKTIDDFGYTLSDSSLNEIVNLIENINQIISSNVDQITSKVNARLQELIDNERKTIHDLVQNKFLVETKMSQARKFANDFEETKKVTENIMKSVESLTSIEEFENLLNESLPIIVSQVPFENIKIISTQGRFFDFLQKVSKQKLNIANSAWASKFQNVFLEFIPFEKVFFDETSKVEKQIKVHINSETEIIAKETQNHFYNKLEETKKIVNKFTDKSSFVVVDQANADRISNELRTSRDNFTTFVNDLEKQSSMTRSCEVIDEMLKTSQVNSVTKEMADVLHRANQIEYLQILVNKSMNAKPIEWDFWFQNVQENISTSFDSFQSEVLSKSEELMKTIMFDVAEIADALKIHFNQNIDLLVMESLPSFLRTGHDALLAMTNRVETTSNIAELSKQIINLAAVLKVNDAKMKKNPPTFVFRQNYLRFLKAFNNEVKLVETSMVLDSFKNVARYVKEHENWFTFLNGVYSEFSKFEYQKDRSLYNVKNIKDWGIKDKTQGLEITKENFNSFLTKIQPKNVPGQSLIQNQELSGELMLKLNRIIENTLKSNSEAICSEASSGSMTVRGNFVKFSDFVGTDGKVRSLCATDHELISLKVFALKTVFVDRSLIASGKKLTVIAPKWDIVEGTKTINLNGQSGKPHEDYLARESDGKAGLPGKPAGSFYGIVETFVNGEKLTIEANGGDGGPGQNGAEGITGRHGSDASRPSNTCRMTGNYHEYHSDHKWSGFYVDRGYKIAGSPGTNGQRGGNGGRPGIGGPSGNIEFVGTNQVVKYQRNGRPGSYGSGGKGGNAGSNGRTITAWCRTSFGRTSLLNWNYEYSESTSRGSNGRSSFAGVVSSPEPATVIGEKSLNLNAYKSFSAENLSSVQKNTIYGFNSFMKSKGI